MLRFCSNCRQQRTLREFDLGGGQLSTTCLGCAHERLRTEDHRARSQRNTQLAALQCRRRELIAALVKADAEIANLRARPTSTQLTALQRRHRRELIAALVKIDAEIADLRARRPPSRVALDDGGEVDEAVFDEDAFGVADPGDSTRDEMS